MSQDAMAKFKEAQRQGWKHFAPLEALTTPAAARLVGFARVRATTAVARHETLGATYTPISIPAFVAADLTDLAVNEIDAGNPVRAAARATVRSRIPTSGSVRAGALAD